MVESNINLDQMEKLAELKEKDPGAYEKKLQAMKIVFVDWFRVMKQIGEEIQKEGL